MSEQLSLLTKAAPRPNRPLAARLDPVTSHLAAVEVRVAGAEVSQARKVWEAICRTPGLTGLELAHAHGIDRYIIGRRASLLVSSGLVAPGKPRRDRHSGRMAQPLYPTSKTWEDVWPGW
ncbi:MAG TPA: hypothetical protein P5144_16020 [Thermoanaerobaculia bacterium]|nr:hypothetical protein [Thermoanaerobaculia bacterium]